jgi:hypothetical protein
VGVRLDKNPVLQFDTHFMTMALPLPCIKFFTRRPDLTTCSNHTQPRDVDELYIWNLSRCDVSLTGVADGEVTMPDPNPAEDIPSLSELVPSGSAVLAPEFHTDRNNSAADCVLTVEAGTVKPLSPLGARQVEYKPLDPELPSSGIRRDLAEGVLITVPAVGMEVTFNIHRRSDNVRWSITIERDVITNAQPLVTLGNTCGCITNSDVVRRDREFAAYYEMLKDPGLSNRRLIPVLREGFVSSGACDVPSSLP